MRNKCRVPNCSICQGGIATNILVKFLGEWSIYMRCRSRRQARLMLKLTRERCSWPLRIEQA